MKRFFYLPLCVFIFFCLGYFFSRKVFASFMDHQAATIVIGQNTFSTTSSGISNSSFHGPTDVFIGEGKLVVTDFYNNRVLIWNTIPTASGTPADVVVGQQNFSDHFANQGGPANANTLHFPWGTIIADGKLIIVDYSNARVLIYNSIPTSNNASADVVIGQPNMTSTTDNQGARGANTLSYPQGVYYDSGSGKLYIADSNNDRVLVYNSIPTLSNQSADLVIGKPLFTSPRTYSSTDKELYNPSDLLVADGKLVVVDDGNNRTVIYDPVPTSDYPAASVVIGQSTMTGALANQGGSVSAQGLDTPNSVAFDETHHRLFISDTNNNRVLIYNGLPTVSNAAADGVLGQTTFTDSFYNDNLVSGANETGLGGPFYMMFNNTLGILGVVDSGNNRVLFYQDSEFVPSPSPSPSPVPTPTPSPSPTASVEPTPSPSSTPAPSQAPQTSQASYSAPAAPLPPPECSAIRPIGAPDLFQIQTKGLSATLFFTPVARQDRYLIEYRAKDNSQVYSTTIHTQDRSGVVKADIHDLQRTAYQFSVRAGNDCSAGDWSNSLNVAITNQKKTQTVHEFVKKIH